MSSDRGASALTKTLRWGIGGAYRATLRRPWVDFEKAAKDPAQAQGAYLRTWLEQHARTAYGKSLGLSMGISVREFQETVPVVNYAALEPWIERSAKGEENVLTPKPIRIFEASSGSTSGRKLIPYTDDLLAEFSAATGPWLWDMFTRRPGMSGRPSYWSLSPVARERETTEGGTPIGFEDDTEYFGPLARWALRQLMAVPSSLAKIQDVDAWRRATALHLLQEPNLGMISVWSPSFLLLLLDAIRADFDSLVEELPKTHADRVRRAVHQAGAIRGDALWPELRLVSCWADGHAESLIPTVRAEFPKVPLQAKGLLATEGVVSFPVFGDGAPNLSGGSVLAVGSHFLEFIDVSAPDETPKLAHELEEGGRYSPLLTTGSGFARYHLEDVVECTGFFHGTPVVRFVGRMDGTSDLRGEKLSSAQVGEALRKARQAHGLETRFLLLAPELGEPPRYRLFLEPSQDADKETTEAFARAVEEALAEIYHYRYCRDLGQLGPVELRVVTDGWATYERTLTERGVRLGDIKPASFDAGTHWSTAFGS